MTRIVLVRIVSENNKNNQLSIYGVVSEVCEEFSTCQTSRDRPVLSEQSDPSFAPANLLIMTPRN